MFLSVMLSKVLPCPSVIGRLSDVTEKIEIIYYDSIYLSQP